MGGWVAVLFSWDAWWLWQYTSKGRVMGVNMDLDLNWFYGGEEEFDRWTQGAAPADAVGARLDRLEKAVTKLCEAEGVEWGEEGSV